MKYFVILFIFIALGNCKIWKSNDFGQLWTTYKLSQKKVYSGEREDKRRMEIFIENCRKIDIFNKRYEKGLVSYKLGLNKYADLTHREFVSLLYGLKKVGEVRNVTNNTFTTSANVEIPAEIDWRNLGAVTPVKDQGHCASCWSFSATGALEGQHFRKTNKLVPFSEQNLIDCSSKYGNAGCRGGLMSLAFQYVKENGGINNGTIYPYEARTGQCRYDPKYNETSVREIVDIESGNEEKLKNAIATMGPISVAIDANHETFQFYSEGIYDEPKCSSKKLNHAVLLVGYGTDEKGKDYWIVKNSWSSTWGEKGYIKMARNKKNMCGIATLANYPLV